MKYQIGDTVTTPDGQTGIIVGLSNVGSATGPLELDVKLEDGTVVSFIDNSTPKVEEGKQSKSAKRPKAPKQPKAKAE